MNLNIYYKQEEDRWVKGDKYLRPLIRKIAYGKRLRLSGMQKVVHNFKKGLDLLNVEYSFNKPFFLLKEKDIVISFGLGKIGLEGYKKKNPIIAAIGFPYPAEFPDLCKNYPVVKFLQHSEWALNLVKSANLYPESIFELWTAGIDTYEWQPAKSVSKSCDVLIYTKIMWNKERTDLAIRQPIIQKLTAQGITFKEIVYGKYYPDDYRTALHQCKAMIFLAEHESQGIAYQECLSCNVPIFAWDQGFWLDPARFTYNKPIVPASSVPFFDERCGMKFKDIQEFEVLFQSFWDGVMNNQYQPREYIMENLTLEKSAEKMIGIYKSIS